MAPECLDAVRERPGLGPACRVSLGFKVFLRDGSAFYTHGGDPHAPEAIDVAHHAGKAPYCAPAGEFRNIAIYTRPSNKADRYAEMAPKIRNMVHLANGHLYGEAQATGGTADFRFACTSGVVTVLSAALATPSSSDTFSSIISDLKALGHSDPKAKYWIWHDDLIDCGCSGIGQLWGDSRRIVENYNNGGSGQAMYAATFYESWSTMLHENGHNMGAVQLDAPDSNTLYHCNDGLDIMCYAEGGQPYSPSVCTGYARFDCHYDSYFNLNPPAGSYLDTAWNIGWVANRFLQFGNVAPVMQALTCVPSTVDPGETATCTFHATDSSLGVAYTVDWGDGSPLQRVPASGYATPGVSVSAAHAWSAPATYTVTVRATDDASPALTSAPMSVSQLVAVRPVFTDPACSAPGGVVPALEGWPLSVPLSARSDAGRPVTITLLAGPAGATLAGTSGNPAHATLSWPSPVLGGHVALVRATDSLGLVRDCAFVIDVRPLAGQALALAAWVGTAVPASADYETTGARATAPGTVASRQGVVDQPAALLYADGVEEVASVALSAGGAVSGGRTQLAHVSLAGGLVVLEGLTQDATLTYDSATGAADVTSAPRIERVTVAGAPVALPAEPTRTEVPLPDGSLLVLYETSLEASPGRAVYRENLVHLYARGEAGRSETILGSLVLRAGAQTSEAPRQARLVEPHDDARSGRDAGGRDDPVAIGPGLVDGRFVGDDRADVYALALRHGENVKLVVEPAKQTHVVGGRASMVGPQPSATLPASRLDPLDATRLRLVDPTGAVREQDAGATAGTTLRVELNADLDGTWLVEVLRESPGGRPDVNYTLATTVAPVPLLSQDDALSGADAPPACGAGAPRIATGAWAGVLRDGDFADVYAFEAELGQLVAATLKPGEDHDGFDAALSLHDENCVLLARSQTALAGAKGVAEAVAQLPASYTGTYYLRIERINGVGNHYLALAVVDPQPALPTNDGGTGADAPDDPAAAQAAPPAAFQGRLTEGDAGDAYKVSFVAGQRATLVFTGSAGSAFDVTLLRPGGAPVAATFFFESQGVWHIPAAESGTYTLVVRPVVGGGSYAVAYGPGIPV